MKAAVRLAILVAALLLFTNMAFAQCDQEVCYNITATFENGYTDSDYWEVCLYNEGTGNLLVRIQTTPMIFIYSAAVRDGLIRAGTLQ